MTALRFPLRSQPSPVKFMGEARLVNCYPEEIGQENRAPVGFLCIPGQTPFFDDAVDTPRGLIPLAELSAFYGVFGSVVWKITSAGVGTALSGALVPGTTPVIMDRGPERFMSAEVTITIASPAVVRWEKHGFAAGTVIRFSTTGELPSGLLPDTDYYVIAAGLATDTFRVSATSGGSAVNTSGTQSGAQTVQRTAGTYQVAIVSDGVVFCIEDDFVRRVTMPEDEYFTSVTVLANRFIYSARSGRNYYSDLVDARTVDPLNYFTAESRPDGMVRALSDGGQLYLGGTESMEVYQPSTESDQPFVPLGGTFISKGVGSRDSMVSFDNAPHWVGHDGLVYRAVGYKAEQVSTPSVERAIAALSDKTSIKAFVDTDRGHSFYVLTCDEWTWVFDAATRVWHERYTRGNPDWLAWPYASGMGKRIVGNKRSAVLSTLEPSIFTENGLNIRPDLILPDIPGELSFDKLEIDLATGTGLNVLPTVNGYDPKVVLSWSDDGGHTWSNERTASVGRQGAWETRVRFNRLGSSRTIRGRRFRIAMSDPVEKAFFLGDIEAA